MKISSAALKAKRSCASGYRWFARRFKSPAEYQSVIDALVADGRVDDACWLLDQFGPIESVLVLDAISADAFVFAGWVQVRGDVDMESSVRTGGSLRAGGSIRSGMHIDAGWGIVAGSDITCDGAIRAGECIVSGGVIRTGAGFNLYAGLSARRDAWPSCGRVISRERPENLLSGVWDCGSCEVLA